MASGFHVKRWSRVSIKESGCNPYKNEGGWRKYAPWWLSQALGEPDGRLPSHRNPADAWRQQAATPSAAKPWCAHPLRLIRTCSNVRGQGGENGMIHGSGMSWALSNQKFALINCAESQQTRVQSTPAKVRGDGPEKDLFFALKSRLALSDWNFGARMRNAAWCSRAEILWSAEPWRAIRVHWVRTESSVRGPEGIVG